MLPMTREDIRQELERLYADARKIQDSAMGGCGDPHSARDSYGGLTLLPVLETQTRILDILERMSSVSGVFLSTTESTQEGWRIPGEWEDITGIRIKFPDGWHRTVEPFGPPIPWDKAISIQEFHARARHSQLETPI